MENLLAEVSKMSKTLHTVASDVSTIKETKKKTGNAMQEWLTEAEGHISDMEDTTQQLVTSRDPYSKCIETL